MNQHRNRLRISSTVREEGNVGTHDKRLSRRLYSVKGGRLTVSELSPAGYRVGDTEAFTVVRPGLEHRTVEPALEHVVEFAARIAPWVEVLMEAKDYR